MNFQKIYHKINEPVLPTPELIQKTLSQIQTQESGSRKQSQQSRKFPIRRLAILAAVLVICLTVPALAAQTEAGYQLLYAAAPAVAQFFQPVQLRTESNGVVMEVQSVRVENDTAQVYLTLSGDSVDESCDLYDSYNFHLPFDQIGSCQKIDYDSETHTAVFLAITQTLDSQPISVGNKMTFSVGCFLSGKQKFEHLPVDLNLTDYSTEALVTDAFSSSGFSAQSEEEIERLKDTPMLLPEKTILAEPVKNLPITAIGYADGLFHVQMQQVNNLELDNHARLWLENANGNRLDSIAIASFSNFAEGDARLDYEDFCFEISPENLKDYRLYGDFYTASSRIEGDWRVTFPLENTWTESKLIEVDAGHYTGSFDMQDTLLTFVSRLEQEENYQIQNANGYDYQLTPMGNQARARFTCPGGKILNVWLERVPYQDTTGLWRASAYTWE